MSRARKKPLGDAAPIRVARPPVIRCVRCSAPVTVAPLCIVCADQVEKARRRFADTVAGRDTHYRKTYGFSSREYRAMFVAQGGMCPVCRRHQEDLTEPLVVDHDHGTGAVRGLLCGTCNTALGMLGDNVDIALRAAAYLHGKGSTPAITESAIRQEAYRRIKMREERKAREAA